MWYKVLTALVLLALWSTPGYAKRECKLERYAELPVTMQDMRPLVWGAINGKPARFMMDSGAFFSILSKDSAKKFGLRLRKLPGEMFITGVNGRADASVTTVEDLSIAGYSGGEVLHRYDFIVVGNAGGNDYDGAIGQNILGTNDTEYDLADGVIRLFLVKGCHHRILAYWAEAAPVAKMRLHRDRENHHIIGTALLNGKKIRVEFDTGTPYSTLTLKAAERVGISLHSNNVADAGLSGGIGRNLTESWIAHFDSLDFNGEVIKNARLRVSNMPGFNADMLLGADFFLSHRIFIANSQRRIYFTYNGGPVFDLRGNSVRAKMARAAPHGDASAAKSPARHADAASLKRRAMALISRREYIEALADFDALIKLAPHDADNYLQRGLAHLDNRQPELALSDLNQALKIKPDLVEAHLTRGAIRLRKGDNNGAVVDFDIARRFAPRDSQVGLYIANAYLYAGKFDQAITEFDKWLAVYSASSNQLPYALTQNCLARALANEQLKLALDACKSARRMLQDNSRLLANLALVYLRLGNYDEAVRYYKKSIDLQPRSAWVLYGLGIAEDRNGAKAEGAQSIQSALALSPGVATDYKKIGLNP